MTTVSRFRRTFDGWRMGYVVVSLVTACSSTGSPLPQGMTNGGSAGASTTSGVGGVAEGGGSGGAGGAGAGTPATGGAASGAGGGSVVAGSAGQPQGGSDLGSDEPYPRPDSLPEEDGAKLWLRYPQVPIPRRLAEYQAALTHIVSPGGAASTDLAETELVEGLSGLTGKPVAVAAAVQGAGAVVIGTPMTSPLIAALPLAQRLSALGADGYLVESAESGGQKVIAVAANTEVGVLYGTFALLRHLQSHSALDKLPLSGSPRMQRRILNHWDNLDRTVERGYAGRSLWDWGALPGTLSPRYKAYARANASIGINGTVLTNVNANAQVLTASYIAKVKALADVFRPYGIRVYLTARFSAPIEIGNLNTADPTNASVKQWWVTKANEIYAQIPDFGGFLVKANSEGQPGPQDYNRTHADGANALADAVAPHGGIVMWRAFVYSESSPQDRIKQAYDEFKPLDGKFKSNVLLQVKNGPLDFQPREPFHSLFGAMPATPLALELQITKEYLGQDTHLAYLGPLYEEVLRADTQVEGAGSTVAKVIDGALHDYATTAIAGVANIGEDTNWTGSQFNQANWYVFGRMAWDPEVSAKNVAEEWVRQTLSNDPLVLTPVVDLMMKSREALVNYMTPLGLVHIMGTDHHYGPGAWVSNLSRAEWNPTYYHKADAQGIGFDRTTAGSNAVAQYAPALAQAYGSRQTVPNELLLFFHHVPWGETLSTGRTVWAELVHRYSQGVDEVGAMRGAWEMVKDRVDAKRFQQVSDFLQTQHYEARWWRDASLAYFSQVSKLPVPSGYAPLAQSLSFYQGLTCPPDVKKPRCTAVYTGTPSPAILP